MTDSLFSRVRADLAHNLQGIKQSDDFNNTVRDVFYTPRSMEAINQFPSVWIDITGYEFQNIGGYQHDVIAHVKLTFYLKTQSPIADRESLVHDVIQKLFEDSKSRIGFLPNSEGETITREVILREISFKGLSEGKPNHQVEMALDLTFSTALDDTSSLP